MNRSLQGKSALCRLQAQPRSALHSVPGNTDTPFMRVTMSAAGARSFVYPADAAAITCSRHAMPVARCVLCRACRSCVSHGLQILYVARLAGSVCCRFCVSHGLQMLRGSLLAVVPCTDAGPVAIRHRTTGAVVHRRTYQSGKVRRWFGGQGCHRHANQS